MKPSITITVLLAMVAISACERIRKPAPPPHEYEKRIAIKLNNDYLPAAKIDSALIIWTVNGQVQEERMQLSNDTLFTPAKDLAQGEGRLTIQVFSRIALQQKNLQWEKSTTLRVDHEKSVTLAAPTNFDDPEWAPRVIHVDQPTNFTIIVALRPEDPYFFMKNVPAGFKIELERHYVTKPGGAIKVGSGLWKCNTVCTDARGIIENRTHFSNLPAQINGRKWEMVEVGVGLFGSNYTSGPGFYFNHY